MAVCRNEPQQGLIARLHIAATWQLHVLKDSQSMEGASAVQGSITLLRKNAQQAPSAEAFASLAEGNLRQGEMDRAATCANVALVMNPHNAVALGVRARCRLEGKDYVGAKEDTDMLKGHALNIENQALVVKVDDASQRIGRKGKRGKSGAKKAAGMLAAAAASRQRLLKTAGRTAELALLKFGRQHGLLVQEQPRGDTEEPTMDSQHGPLVQEQAAGPSKESNATKVDAEMAETNSSPPAAEKVVSTTMDAELQRHLEANKKKAAALVETAKAHLQSGFTQRLASLERHLKEMNRLSLQSAELKASLEQVKCSLATAKAKQTKTAETLADYTSQWRAAQHQLAQQQAESRQLQLTNDSLSSSLSQVTVSLKAIQAEHHNCTEALKACTDNKEVAENQVQQQQNHIACMDSNLVEARKGLQHLGTQVEQQAEALTARKAALKLADQQVVRLEAQQAQHAQALAKSTADKETAQMQLRQETSARLEVQQQLDALLQAQQQQLVQTSSRQTGDSEAQTEASSTEELAALTATAEAHRKMQQWMCDLFRLKSQKKANRLHLRSANTALKRHSAGTATARQKTCEELEVVKTFAEQEGEKLHVDCCQLKVSLWLLVEGSNITAQPADVFSQQDDIGPAGSVGEDCKLLQQSPDVAAAISSASNFAAVSNTDAVPVSDTAAATHVRQPDAEVSTDMSAAERKRHKNRRRQERRTARGQVASTDVAVRANIAAQGADLRLLSADQSASPSPQAETAGPQQPMQLSTDVTQDGYDMTAGQHESVRQLDSSGPDGMASMQSKLNLDVLKAEVPPVHVADQSTQQQLEAPDVNRPTTTSPSPVDPLAATPSSAFAAFTSTEEAPVAAPPQAQSSSPTATEVQIPCFQGAVPYSRRQARVPPPYLPPAGAVPPIISRFKSLVPEDRPPAVPGIAAAQSSSQARQRQVNAPRPSQAQSAAASAEPGNAAVFKPQGSWATAALAGQLRQAAAASLAPTAGLAPAASAGTSSSGTVKPRGPHITAPTVPARGGLQATPLPITIRPAATVPAVTSTITTSHPMPLVGKPRRVPPQGSPLQSYTSDSDKVWCRVCVAHSWPYYTTIRGDGECGFRTMAVGAVLAVHRLPNWEVASAAFAAHMQSLHCGVRPGLVKVQKAPPDGATAAQGLSFITELITNRNFQDPAALFEACANPTVSNSLVMLFRCMVCEALLRKQEMDPEFFPLMVSQYDDHSPHRPASMREACYKYLAHMMVRGPGGTADPGEPLKQATGTVLGILGEALQMQVLVGSGSTTAHELTEGHSSSGPCWRDARICILSHDSHFNLAWE